MTFYHYATAYYDVLFSTDLEAYYDILYAAEWEWVVQIKDKSFTHDNFYGGKIVKKLQQIHTFTAVFHDLTASDLADFIKQGNDIRVLVNTRVVFSGEITRVIVSDNKRTWTVECNSTALKLRNRKIKSLNEWEATEADEIIKAILPATCWQGTIDTAPVIDYKTEYSDVLEQVANICQQTNFEWDCREEYVELTSTGMTHLGGGVDQITFSGPPYGTEQLQDYLCSDPRDVYFFAFAINNSIKNRGGYVDANSGNTFNVGAYTAGFPTPFSPFSNGDSGTKFRIYRAHRLDFKDNIGRDYSVDTLKIGREIINAERTNDVGRIITKVIVPGQSSGAEELNSVYSANTLSVTELAYSEAYITNEASKTATTIKVSTTSGLPALGMVYCEGEKIHYSAKTSNSLTGCTRGMMLTTAATHTYGAPIVSTDCLITTSTALFDPTGSIWVGMEKIDYESVDGTTFWDLTRGADSSTIYNHAKGIYVRDAQWSDTTPETGSPIDLYGIIEDVKPSKGGVNRNALDFYAQSQIAIKSGLKEWGNAVIVGPNLRNELTYGDHIYIEERTTTSTTYYRVMGMTWDMMRATITLEFGDTEEWVLDKLSSIDRIQQQATIKSTQPQLGTVTQVSASKQTAYVTLDSGEQVIVRIK